MPFPQLKRRLACVVAAGLVCLAVDPPAAWAHAFDDEDDVLLEALGDTLLFLDTEVLVSGATRRVAKLSEAPGTIAIIDGKDLRERGVLTLDEAIRYVTSITFAPASIALTTEIRDIEQDFSNKVLLLQDGRLLNSVFRGNFFLDLSQPIDNVARIEVVRGPGSALYGANAFAGFINVITLRGDQIDGIEVTGSAGSHSLGHASFLSGARKGEHNWTVQARHARSDGFDVINADEPSSEHRDSHVAFHWGKGSSKGENWFANFSYTDVEAGVPGSFDFPTPGNSLAEERLSLDGFKLWEPSTKVKLKLRGYYNKADNQYAFQHADLDISPIGDAYLNIIGRQAYDANLVRLMADPLTEEPDDGLPGQPDPCVPCDHFVLRKSTPLGGGTAAEFFDIIANGLPQAVDVQDSDEWLGFTELQADWQVSKSNYLLGGVSVRIDDLDNAAVAQEQFRNNAVFVEDEQRFLNGKLILLGSLRADDHSYFGLSVSPRVSLIWSPNKKLIMKTAYGKAFRSPNFVELFGETRVGTARIFGQQRAVEAGVIPDEFTEVECLDPPNCTMTRTLTFETELVQEEIQTVELWTEFTPIKRFKLIVNLYKHEITNEVGLALDRNDLYYQASHTGVNPAVSESQLINPAAFPMTSTLFAIPGFEDVPTLGVFLNAPDKTKGVGAEVEVRANPWDWFTLDWNYSRRENEKALVGDFVETDSVLLEGVLRPTFSVRRFSSDQTSAVFAFHKKERFWASLRVRVLGRPNESVMGGSGAITSDLTVGLREKNFTVAATVLNLNEGGTLFDVRRDEFVAADRELRLSLSFRHAF